jgi:hypothetical protein
MARRISHWGAQTAITMRARRNADDGDREQGRKARRSSAASVNQLAQLELRILATHALSGNSVLSSDSGRCDVHGDDGCWS